MIKAIMGLIIILIIPLSTVAAEQISFDELIKDASRHKGSQGITHIYVKDDTLGTRHIFHNIEIITENNIAIIILRTQLMAGNRTASYTYPLTEQIKKEKFQLTQYNYFREYTKELYEIQRKLRIIENSNYQLNHLSRTHDIIRVFGETDKKTGRQKTGAFTLHYPKHDIDIWGYSIRDIKVIAQRGSKKDR